MVLGSHVGDKDPFRDPFREPFGEPFPGTFPVLGTCGQGSGGPLLPWSCDLLHFCCFVDCFYNKYYEKNT